MLPHPWRSGAGGGAVHSINGSGDLSLDHLVGAGEHCGRHVETQHPRSLEIDDKLNLDRLHDGKLRRLRPLKDAACIDADESSCNVGSITHEPASFSVVTHGETCWNPITRCQVCKLHAPVIEEHIGPHEQGI